MELMQSTHNKRLSLGIAVVVSLLAYYVFAYHLERVEFLKLGVLYTALFTSFIYIVTRHKQNFKLLATLAILFRLLFLIAIPNLSQDFYRFIWDGRMLLEGLNPYLFTPDTILETGTVSISQGAELHKKMGALSAGNHTNYPPFNQLLFAVAALFSGNSIIGSAIVLRVIIILADIGTLIIGKKLLRSLNFPIHRIFWYLLNPFILIELTGNLHFEGVMVFFLLFGLYLLHTKSWQKAAVAFAISVSVKLIPLMFIPLLLKNLGWKKWFGFSSLVGGLTSLSFLPFFSLEFAANYLDTVGLWFQKFEFNASIYYIIREVGKQFTGYNEIAIIGPALSFFTILFILFTSSKDRNQNTRGLLTSMLLVLSFYFFTTTTMHPWYLVTVLGLSIFTNYRFPLVWSFVVIGSYFAYSGSDAHENYWILFIEYGAVYGVLIYELIKNRSIKKPISTTQK